MSGRCTASGTTRKRTLKLDIASDGFVIGSIDFCPIECELVDYKESAFGDAVALAKGIKHIVALHNTYGGYLVLGVAEVTSEKFFKLNGFDSSLVDLKQIKDKIFSYTGSHIQISL